MAKPDHTVLARPSVASQGKPKPLALDPPRSADAAKPKPQSEPKKMDVVVAMFALFRLIKANDACREAKLNGRPMHAPHWPLRKDYADGLSSAILHLSDYARTLGLNEWVDD